ncbi:MAG TPA: hypothetical protein VGB89_03655 [Bacteroidota bacterium]|jgi:hypothetical protein
MRSRTGFVSLSCYYLLTFFLLGCDKGIQPTQAGGGGGAGTMTGLITYRNWPTIDSLHDLRIIAFRLFPPTNVVNEVLQGRAIVYPSLGDTSLVPFFVDSLRYSFTLASGTYQYVVIAQQFGPSVTTDWRPVGQFDLDSNLTQPSTVDIVAGEATAGIDILVDFANPPPAPF